MSDPLAFRTEGFMDYLGFERGLSPRTLSAYRRDLAGFLDFAAEEGIDAPEAVTHLHIREFVFTLKDRGLAPTSIRRCQSALRTYFGFLLAEGVVADDPTEMMESPKIWRRRETCLPSRESLETATPAPR